MEVYISHFSIFNCFKKEEEEPVICFYSLDILYTMCLYETSYFLLIRNYNLIHNLFDWHSYLYKCEGFLMNKKYVPTYL